MKYTITKYEPAEIRDQVISQLKAIEHLAHVLARLHSDKALIYATCVPDQILNLVGQESARLMEVLGDVLNNMDAVTEEDARFDQVFERAQELWPARQATPDAD